MLLLLLLSHGPVAAELTNQPTAALSPDEVLYQRFEKDFWPLLTRGADDSCISCHDAETSSELRFFSDPESSFRILLEHGYFSGSDPDSLLGRLSSSNPKKRMPKGKDAQPWSEGELERLREFISKLNSDLKFERPLDEQFPSALVRPYGEKSTSPDDTQFLSYRQLKGKVQLIFDDDWVRHGRDLFQDNIALFGGADFKERFNESTKASPTSLAGLEMMSRDVAARAYVRRTGPFADHSNILRSPLSMDEPDGAYADAISQLYRKVLFRSPAPAEVKHSFALLRRVYEDEAQIRQSDFELSFNLTVEDPETGLRSSESISIPVAGAAGGLYQEWTDQSHYDAPEPESTPSEKPAKRKDRRVSEKLGKSKLGQTFHLRPNDPRQVLTIYNAKSIGNVSFHSAELRRVGSLETNETHIILATNSAVQAEGAWKVQTGKGLTSLEDENNDKGSSAITVTLGVQTEGEYELTVAWRQSAENAREVLVEVFSQDPSRLTAFAVPAPPPEGEAHYFIDESNDAIAFADLKTRFRFGPTDYVEINNRGTRNRVTADAVKFIPSAGGPTIVVDNDEAEGRENWKAYDSGQFRAYNQTGKDSYHDENARKGELFLRYLPSLKKESWKADQFYQVQVGYPAKRDHEIHAPVVVRAQQSSPILQVAHPLRAQVGALLQIDASRSYTVQGSPLKFQWQQTGGPAVVVADWKAAVLNFQVPTMGAQQAAWEALCRALMQHPDFLFTRPPSTSTTTDSLERNRLLLVKIAQDLLARPPTDAERAKIDAGQPLGAMVAEYLESEEFRDFYFHRIRLYLESQGSETQDEPARLWCYIAFHDRPFQEILTAEYTVDSEWQKQPRPAWFGRTGILTTRGFIDGKPGLPHFNYAAQVAELFLGYVFEVPPEVVAQRDGITAASTTDPASVCYSCHKILTPLAFQRNRWDDLGRYRAHDEYGLPIDDSDQRLVASYPFPGDGLEAFALQAVKKERFIRTMINTHFTFYFGREMRYLEDERGLYKRLWDQVHHDGFAIRSLIKALLTSPEYLGTPSKATQDQRTTRTEGRSMARPLQVGLNKN